MSARGVPIRQKIGDFAVCALAGGLAPAARAQVDISTVADRMAGPHAQVLVLGSVHLSNAPKEFRPESLQPVLDRLAAFKPQVITVEQLSGETCDLMARHPTVYDPKDVGFYCVDTAKAKAATGLDVPAAIAEIRRTLRTWPAQPDAAQRRHLAALFLAAGDPTSAMVQWLQLPAAERRAGDGLDANLVEELGKRMMRNNESLQIAAALAARLGLQRVFPVDDHTGDNVYIADEAGYDKAIQAAWNSSAPVLKPIHEAEDAMLKRSDMLALYRYVNDPKNLSAAIRGDFGAALADPSPGHFGQLYVAGWEARNLRMAANVRAAFGEIPGARVLCVVGSSHKPWFDRLLGQMQGVDIVDVEQVLGGTSADNAASHP